MAGTVANLNYRTRIVGSSYTVWTANGAPVVWCVDIDHESPRTVADPVPIQPLNYIRPAEIIVPRAISYGKITMNVIETYGHKPWEHLNGFFPQNKAYQTSEADSVADLADVLNYMQDQLTSSDASSLIELYRIIRTPASATTAGSGSVNNWYVTRFAGVRITDIRENEKANTNAMQNNFTIEAMYTRKYDSQFTPGGSATVNAANGAGAFGSAVPSGPIGDTTGTGYLGL